MHFISVSKSKKCEIISIKPDESSFCTLNSLNRFFGCLFTQTSRFRCVYAKETKVNTINFGRGSLNIFQYHAGQELLINKQKKTSQNRFSSGVKNLQITPFKALHLCSTCHLSLRKHDLLGVCTQAFQSAHGSKIGLKFMIFPHGE